MNKLHIPTVRESISISKNYQSVAVNVNKVIARFKTGEDRVADRITAASGTIAFVYVHALWFGFWILMNTGVFGSSLQFDEFPYGLLTLIVSLEAIFLSTFVMITQNREARESRIRNEVGFINQEREAREVQLIVATLERIAQKQGVSINDLMDEFHNATEERQKKIDELMSR